MPRHRNPGAPRHRSAALMVEEIEKRIARRKLDVAELAESLFVITPGETTPGILDPPDGQPDQRIIDDDQRIFNDLEGLPEPVAPESDTGLSIYAARADHEHEGVHAIHVAGQPLLTGDIPFQAGEGVEIVQTGQAIEIAAPGTGEGFLIQVVELQTADIGTAPLTGQQFTLSHYPWGPVGVYIQGIRMTLGVDYTVSGNVVELSRYAFDTSPFPDLDFTTARLTFDFWYRVVGRTLKTVWQVRQSVGKTLDLVYNVASN